MIKKNPRCQIFNIRSRRSPRIQRGPYVFLFSYMVYHQIWLILLLASHHFVYTTKLNKKKKKQKKQSKKHWLQGIGTGRKKGSCQLRYVVAQLGEMGKVPRVYRGARIKHLHWYFHHSKETLISSQDGIFTKKTFMLFTFSQIVVPVSVLGPG